MKICRQESCDVHYWQAGMWSECVASNVTMGCGRGYRTRDVACVLRLGDDEGGGVRVVQEWKCLLLVQPSVSLVINHVLKIVKSLNGQNGLHVDKTVMKVKYEE